MGINGVDVAGLRPFDLVIPFTIQKGEITGTVVRGVTAWWPPAVPPGSPGDLVLLSKVRSECRREK